MKICTCKVCGQLGHDSRYHNKPPKEKVCKRCKIVLPIENFWQQKHQSNSKIYYSCYCKSCDVKRTRDRKELSIENRLKWLASSIKNRNKAVDVDFLDLKEIFEKQKGKCYYTDEILTSVSGYNAISVDRKDSSRGYEKDNIVLCLWRINSMKSNLLERDFINICKRIYETFNSKRGTET